MAERMFNVTKDHNRFVIRGESVAETAIWLGKKKYALKKVYDLEKNKDVDKLQVKGLDTVRSNFPPSFRNFTKELLLDFLNKVSKSEIDTKIIDFRKVMNTLPVIDIAKSTSVQNVTKYDNKSKSLLDMMNKTPAHVKASLVHNRLIKQLKIKNCMPINDGNKIKWVYLKDNPYKISEVAFKGYDDPIEILNLVETYVDRDKIFELELKNKLQNFYNALGYGLISTDVNQYADHFFGF